MPREDWAVELRPKNFDQMVGQEANREVLKKWIETDTLPSAMIFFGKSGCGKTTSARIIPLLMDAEVIELDAASNNSVDDIRDINNLAGRLSLTGRHKIFIIDECFPAGTKISTSEGLRNIEDIKAGDAVKCVAGTGTVEAVFSKEISKEEIVEVIYDSDCSVQATKQHLFLTQRGWIQAQNLVKGDILYGEALSDLWGASSANRPEDLLEAVRDYLSEHYSQEARSKKMQDLRKGVFSKALRPASGLFEGMSLFIDRLEEQRKEMLRDASSVDDGTQSGDSREDKGHKEKEWDGRFTSELSARQWAYYRAAEIVVRSLGLAVEIRDSDSNWCEACAEGWISDLLQGGYWVLGKEDSSGGGWRRTLLEMLSVARCQEDQTVRKFRVDSVKVYQQRDIAGCISSGKQDSNSVVVYDLQVREHPSYFVNGVAVHNCHMLSQSAWNSLLKTLEEPDSKTHFVLCTTEYTKLPLTIRGRSTMLKFYSIPAELLTEYAEAVLEHKGYSLPNDVIALIVQQAKGQVRDLLKILQVAAEGNLDTLDKLRKFLAIPDGTGMRNFINAVLSGEPKIGIPIIRAIETDLLEWTRALQQHIYQLLEDKYGVSSLELVLENANVSKARKLAEKFDDKAWGALLTALNKINQNETAYAQLYALLFTGVNK